MAPARSDDAAGLASSEDGDDASCYRDAGDDASRCRDAGASYALLVGAAALPGPPKPAVAADAVLVPVPDQDAACGVQRQASPLLRLSSAVEAKQGDAAAAAVAALLRRRAVRAVSLPDPLSPAWLQRMLDAMAGAEALSVVLPSLPVSVALPLHGFASLRAVAVFVDAPSSLMPFLCSAIASAPRLLALSVTLVAPLPHTAPPALLHTWRAVLLRDVPRARALASFALHASHAPLPAWLVDLLALMLRAMPALLALNLSPFPRSGRTMRRLVRTGLPRACRLRALHLSFVSQGDAAPAATHECLRVLTKVALPRMPHLTHLGLHNVSLPVLAVLEHAATPVSLASVTVLDLRSIAMQHWFHPDISDDMLFSSASARYCVWNAVSCHVKRVRVDADEVYARLVRLLVRLTPQLQCLYLDRHRERWRNGRWSPTHDMIDELCAATATVAAATASISAATDSTATVAAGSCATEAAAAPLARMRYCSLLDDGESLFQSSFDVARLLRFILPAWTDLRVLHMRDWGMAVSSDALLLACLPRLLMLRRLALPALQHAASAVPLCTDVLPQLKHLQHLSLTSCHVSDDHVAALVCALGNMHQLQTLDLSDNSMSGAAPSLQQLLAVLDALAAFHHLTLNPRRSTRLVYAWPIQAVEVGFAITTPTSPLPSPSGSGADDAKDSDTLADAAMLPMVPLLFDLAAHCVLSACRVAPGDVPVELMPRALRRRLHPCVQCGCYRSPRHGRPAVMLARNRAGSLLAVRSSRCRRCCQRVS